MKHVILILSVLFLVNLSLRADSIVILDAKNASSLDAASKAFDAARARGNSQGAVKGRQGAGAAAAAQQAPVQKIDNGRKQGKSLPTSSF